MIAEEALAALSRWIDAGNAHRDPEAVTWGRLAKLSEESGEVIAAFIGATGQNPRKGVTATTGDVVEELLDVAVTALGAIEHLTGHQSSALDRLEEKILAVAQRAGLTVEGRCRECGCTDDQACFLGCSWVEPDLCSSCTGEPTGGEPR